MHNTVRQYVKRIRQQLPGFFYGRRVLEVGSLDINGTVRDYFHQCQYTGIDVGPGPCVDFVSHVLNWPVPPCRYEVVVSTEALEHDKLWRESLARMYDLLHPGGLLLVTCAGPRREEHGTHFRDPAASPHTLDHYHGLTPEEVRSALGVPVHFQFPTDVDLRFLSIRCLTER